MDLELSIDFLLLALIFQLGFIDDLAGVFLLLALVGASSFDLAPGDNLVARGLSSLAKQITSEVQPLNDLDIVFC